MRRGWLVVMVKVPGAGRVKSRLGRDIGMVDAAWWFRHQLRRTIRRLRDPRWHLVLAVSPDRDGMTSAAFPRDVPRVPQGAGDLGDRMGRILRSMPPGPVCVIGADIPSVTASHIADAFAALGRAPAVFGPAKDGGYWLVGLRRTAAVPAGLFDGVRWSTKHALKDSIHSLGGLPAARVAKLRDVDTAKDLARIAKAGGATGRPRGKRKS